jgi:proteic killer suppression protein
MEIEFANRPLARRYQSESLAQRAWSEKVARRYIMRVNLIQNAREFDDLFTFPELHIHPLTGGREGGWAMTLQGRWRLIIERQEDDSILVKEVTNHYDD